MKIKCLSFIFALLMVSNPAFARIGLDISILYKKGIDNKLLLSSELHAHEDVEDKEAVSLSMSNGVTANVSAQFISDNETYGPNPLIELDIKIYDGKGPNASILKASKINILAGEEKSIEHKDNKGRKIVFKIKPEIL